ncbi:phospholipid-transporting ATPase ABCA3-like [Haemaphysalis longicornis]
MRLQFALAEQQHHDSEVAAEDELVDRLVWQQRAATKGPHDKGSMAMLVCRLYRSHGYHGRTPVLQGLSFGLRQGERLALLGADGAGMTTMFRILTGEIVPHQGDAYIQGFSLVNQAADFKRYLGYCPQRDGLLATLTGVETVTFYCRLRGITPTPQYLDAVLEIFGLKAVGDRAVRTYSFGSKRKLSVCVAMLGLPSVVLLDDPYASMGTTSRRRIAKYLGEIQKERNMSLLITTHSISEVWTGINRIAILAEGRLQCLGSVSRLENLLGKSLTISIRTGRDSPEEHAQQRNLAHAVRQQFPDAELTQNYEGTLEYRISGEKLLWSDVFERMARLKRRFKFRDYFVEDTSPQQVFMTAAQKKPVLLSSVGGEEGSRDTGAHVGSDHAPPAGLSPSTAHSLGV